MWHFCQIQWLSTLWTQLVWTDLQHSTSNSLRTNSIWWTNDFSSYVDSHFEEQVVDFHFDILLAKTFSTCLVEFCSTMISLRNKWKLCLFQHYSYQHDQIRHSSYLAFVFTNCFVSCFFSNALVPACFNCSKHPDVIGCFILLVSPLVVSLQYYQHYQHQHHAWHFIAK